MYKLFGIKNCDTMKKAAKWLTENNINYELVDYKKNPPTSKWLTHMIDTHGVNNVLNTRGTTYRKLDDASKEILASDNITAIVTLLCTHSSMIKRPILQDDQDDQDDNDSLIGFNVEQYAQFFSKTC